MTLAGDCSDSGTRHVSLSCVLCLCMSICSDIAAFFLYLWTRQQTQSAIACLEWPRERYTRRMTRPQIHSIPFIAVDVWTHGWRGSGQSGNQESGVRNRMASIATKLHGD